MQSANCEEIHSGDFKRKSIKPIKCPLSS